MAKKNRKKVEKKLTISYRVKNFLSQPVPFFVGALLLLDVMGVSTIIFHFPGKYSFASSSALQLLATIAESSATILAIFVGFIVYLLESRASELRKFGATEFFSSCITFSISIIWSLNNMLIIKPNVRVDCTVVFVPAYLFIASLIILFLFIYKLFRK